eukprot:CAMPEP_0182864058 /NCGR_PEP_ID=MMETSP0034_2-20130328/6975_1 /TAXON_ID=156128 /ORGANISM="Nephroselmis pyriformis, Strain CCMP717" /LENGTH=438 /DNA_ID=CAMNT_0024996305 /DNA_START=45 /DNA_END=1358 /DNA_ORIENTATION=-
MAAADLAWDGDRFTTLLGKIMGESKHLQNNFPELIPKEDRAARHVLDALEPYSKENGGPLLIHHVAYVEGRGNIIVEYPGTSSNPEDILSFVGCHLDVVPANPDLWDRDPFKLTVEGDELHGRGATDCLGHVALLAEFFTELGKKRPKLTKTVVGVWIANEENSHVTGIGVDELVKRNEAGVMSRLKPGPLFWVDTADKQPCIGTGGVSSWTLTAKGKLFHSGLPHKTINPIELAMEALAIIQRRFYEDHPGSEKEKEYRYATPCTMKPTQVNFPGGSINQIPGECTICGDIRITPFYSTKQVMADVDNYVADINADLSKVPTRGPVSKYVLEDGLRGSVELKWGGGYTDGVACKLDSPGFAAMKHAFGEVFGKCEPFSITGSLPCIRELQEEGYDVQTMGFGLMSTYHANNEYALLSDMEKGFKTIVALVAKLDEGG